jgi:DNA-binding FrmR family transcriptional regulator
MSEQNETHTHVLADGTIVEHTHGEPQETHTHVSEDGTIVEHTHGEPQETHTHVLEDGTVIEHTHGEHGHSHSHAHTKAVINRLSRAIGHLESIRRMVENGRDCTEVLIQLSAVKSAINNTGKIILQDHIEHCIVDAVEHDDREALKELERAIDRFMK